MLLSWSSGRVAVIDLLLLLILMVLGWTVVAAGAPMGAVVLVACSAAVMASVMLALAGVLGVGRRAHIFACAVGLPAMISLLRPVDGAREQLWLLLTNVATIGVAGLLAAAGWGVLSRRRERRALAVSGVVLAVMAVITLMGLLVPDWVPPGVVVGVSGLVGLVGTAAAALVLLVDGLVEGRSTTRLIALGVGAGCGAQLLPGTSGAALASASAGVSMIAAAALLYVARGLDQDPYRIRPASSQLAGGTGPGCADRAVAGRGSAGRDRVGPDGAGCAIAGSDGAGREEVDRDDVDRDGARPDGVEHDDVDHDGVDRVTADRVVTDGAAPDLAVPDPTVVLAAAATPAPTVGPQRSAARPGAPLGGAAVGPIAADLALLYAAIGQEVLVEVHGDPWVSVDSDGLAQLLATLLANCARHAPGAQVRVRAAARGPRVRIEVIDDGPGFPPGSTARLLRRGVRGPGSTGAGLGLAICTELVQKYRGSFTVVSTSSGCTAVMEFPTARRSASAQAVSA